MQVRWQALAGFALWLTPHVAQAWADGLFCDLPQADAFQEELDDEGLAMCTPSAPHLLRSPSFDTCAPNSGRSDPQQAPTLAATALARARQLADQGLYEEALLNLRVVEATLPRIADHVAILRAELHELHADPVRAATAYREALERTPDIELRARARVGYVRSLLRAGDPKAELELSSLLARYPQLPEAPKLRLELGRHRELTGQVKSALGIYRAIDLAYPGYPMAAEARERMVVLGSQGQVVAPYSEPELLERTARLIRSGPVEQARTAVADLRLRPFSRALLKRRDDLVAHFEELEQRRFARTDLRPAAVVAADPGFEQFRKKLAAPNGEKQLAKLGAPTLVAQLAKAGTLKATDVANAIVRELVHRPKSCSPELRFEALTVAAGSASDLELVALADTLVSEPLVAVPARYHRARALERAGKLEEAMVELDNVVALDSSPTRFYANWAEQRLRELQGRSACRAAGRTSDCNRPAIEATLQALESNATLDVPRAVALLAPLEAVHGLAYPWLSRALDLARVGDVEHASDELHEAYLAWRFVSRRGALRAGREAVYRGAAIASLPTDIPTHRARILLNEGSRFQLAEVASALGDWGTAVDFGGSAFAEQHPAPYAAEVARAARKYGLDPDLLFAVMRVESVYQRRIISHAGAIGLMQIMPRTGRLIADKLGQHQMTATDLLDPRTNIEFSAWYLSSLLVRMDGRLPLAIASYNGGPQNVRAWIQNCGTHVPLDAFLERIPFRETKRYVRRVLGYYANYKAQRGQNLDLMGINLPGDDPLTAVAF